VAVLIGSKAGGFELDGFEMMGSNTIDSNWGIGLWIRGAASFLGFELGQGGWVRT
jgi:hypothetical protein